MTSLTLEKGTVAHSLCVKKEAELPELFKTIYLFFASSFYLINQILRVVKTKLSVVCY